MRILLNRSKFVGLLLFTVAELACLSFSLTPTSMDFEPSGRGATRIFTLENKTEQPAAIQISMIGRTMDIDGKESYTTAESLFVVFPPQATLKPGQRQKVSVRWIGPATLTNELAFRMLAEQLPVALSKEEAKGANVKMVIRYLAAIYVVPKNAKGDVLVESVKPLDGKQAEVVLHNFGNGHVLLQNAQIHLTCPNKNQPITYTSEELKGLSGENMLAGNKRRFRIPLKEGLCTNALEAKLEFLPVR